ncbi:alpha/beta hydrolase [Seleniivibrio woodruffii]|uniref:Alpha/beta superfamily hydrolase n=1 Tax=Seleniivibrio woodruffii TaxID=1078050 RepID=A0A4R1KD65_9BACT|nr:alpha/beta fold hydrolase [Seleniivibrio woodruffii]TCK62000.1 hypothetical protein C8D98_0508 [Seleniivibrio woodruffii]TVZ34883.1 hypothetical protein OF66_0484 [Seleniivibrio woodruffii]
MKKLLILSVLLSAAFGLHAEPVIQKAMYAESRYSQFYTFHYDKAVSADGKRTYRIVTAVPKKSPRTGGYPVVYALDGNAALHHVSEKQLGELSAGEPPVLVSIGYETDELFDMPSRTYDFTPKRSDGKPAVDALDTSRTGGGADEFLTFIENRVFLISEKYAHVNNDKKNLFGHSYGGLFVLYALSARPDMFKNFVSADPALWWQDGDFYKSITESEPKGLKGKNVFMLKGAAKQAYTPAQEDSERVKLRKKLYGNIPSDASLSIIRKLSSADGVRTQYIEYGWLSHGPLFPVSLDFALKAASE